MNGIVIIVILVAVIIGISILGQILSKTRYDRYMNNNFVKFEQNIANTGFMISKKTGIDYSWLYVDDTASKFILYSGNPDTDIQAYCFNDLIDFELLEDGKCIVVGNTTDSLTKQWVISDDCINLQLLVRVNDSDRTERILSLISPKTSIPRNEIYHLVKELMDNLSYILDCEIK